jgi:two-component system, chemotaxis family, response regulator Rcp1
MHPNRRRTIVVVEDNPADVALIRLALEEAGVECVLVLLEDGERAIHFVRGMTASDARPDLVILDLNLPKSDGMEVLAAMRSTQAFAEVPVAILSSSSSQRERERMDVYRVHRYLAKPPDLEEFLQIGFTIKELLEDTRGRSA